MPFIAECPFCSGKVRVPTSAEGQSAECPRCGDSFTLVPMLNPPREGSEPPRPAGPRIDPPSRSTPHRMPAVAAPSTETSVPATAVDRPATPPRDTTPVPPRVLNPPRPRAVPPPRRRPAPGPGLGAFVLGGLALALFALPATSLLAWPLAGLGLLLGVVGLSSWTTAEGKSLYPLVGTAVCLAALGMGAWGLATRVPPRSDEPPRATTAVQATGAAPVPVEEGEWIDVRRGAVRLHDISVRVAGVRVGPPQFKDTRRQRPSRERRPALFLTLTLMNLGMDRRAEYASWGLPPRQPEQAALVLRDDRGRTYPRRLYGPGQELAGQSQGGMLPPAKRMDDVLAFEPPPPDVAYLRLELPGSALGESGSLRLQIPAELISR